MQQRWKQAGLTFLSALAVMAVAAGFVFMVANVRVPPSVMRYGGPLLLFAAYLAAVTFIERRTPTELSPRHALPELAGGLLAGIALFALVMAMLWVAGAYRLDGLGSFDGLVPGLLFFFAAAAIEEILYRGLLFRLCATLFGTTGALVIGAVVFGTSHAHNPGATPTGLVSVALAGVLLGAIYAATQRLWLPIGLHTGWNFAEGSVFGTLVSGNDATAGAISGTLTGPDYLTGGAFGPEASIMAVIVIGATTAYWLWRIVRLRRVEPPIWKPPLLASGKSQGVDSSA